MQVSELGFRKFDLKSLIIWSLKAQCVDGSIPFLVVKALSKLSIQVYVWVNKIRIHNALTGPTECWYLWFVRIQSLLENAWKFDVSAPMHAFYWSGLTQSYPLCIFCSYPDRFRNSPANTSLFDFLGLKMVQLQVPSAELSDLLCASGLPGLEWPQVVSQVSGNVVVRLQKPSIMNKSSRYWYSKSSNFHPELMLHSGKILLRLA